MIAHEEPSPQTAPNKQRFHYDCQIDHKAKVLTINCYGELALADCLQLILAIRHMDEEVQHYSRLYDLTKLTTTDLSVSEFDTILMNAKSAFTHKMNTIKVAFVTSDTLNFNMAMLFKTMSQRFQFQEVEVFTSCKAALIWFEDALGK